MTNSETQHTRYPWVRIKGLFVFALFVLASGAATAQVGSNTYTQIVHQLLLSECPIDTEPPLKVCTPPVLETQAHINAFKDVKVVKGHLQIEAQTDLDFSPLNKLREIHGILYLTNGELSTINGFNNLESIGARAASFGNGHQLYIENNPNLTSVSGFEKLKKSTHPESRSPAIFVRFNPALRQVSGFTALDQAAVISIRRNPLLTGISGFNSLQNIDSGIGLTITDTSLLNTIPSFANLTTINGSLELYDLPGLNSLPAFQALSSVRRLRINNLGISELGSFKNSGLQNISGLYITNNSKLERISGFTNLVNIAGERGDLSIGDNSLLDEVTGFTRFINSDPTDYISVADNPKLNCPVELSMLEEIAYSESNLSNCPTTPYPF